jgi:hypothetical protein
MVAGRKNTETDKFRFVVSHTFAEIKLRVLRLR